MGDQLLARGPRICFPHLINGVGCNREAGREAEQKNVVCQRENKIQFSASPNQETIINQYEKHQTTGSINFDDN